MADEAVPGNGTGQGDSGESVDLAGFHKALQRRSDERDSALHERDAAKAELEALRSQLAELNQLGDEDEDDGEEPPTPRGNNAARQVGTGDDGSVEWAERQLERYSRGASFPRGWPV